MRVRRPLNILQIVSSSATSGGEWHVFHVAERLIRRGHNVQVICPHGGWLPKELRESGIVVHETHMKGSGWIKTVGLVRELIKSQRFDLVHSHLTRATYFGAIGATLTRIPAIATVHIANHDQIYKRMAFGRNRLIAVSNYVRGLLHGRGIGARYIDTVYNGTDFTEIARHADANLHHELGIPGDRKLIGLVGRVCREKGHLEMVEAMKRIVDATPEAHAVFVGRMEPAFEPEIREAIHHARLEERITMAGLRFDIPRMLDGFAFSAMPSHKETFGIAAIEAMARGKPVIATKVGGLPELVRHNQTGLLVDLDPESISEASAYLLNNEDELARMGANGRMLVEEKFTLNQMVMGLEEVYAKALG